MAKYDRKSRLARLKEEYTADEQKESGVFRKWVVDTKALEKAEITEWRPKEGKNFVQFLPANDPENKHSIGMSLWFHRNVGPNNDTYLCLKKMFGKACPICEEFQKRRNESWEDIRHLSIGKYPSAWLFLLVDVTSEETIDVGVQSYVACKTVRDEVINVVDPRTGEPRFLPNDPEEGRVFCFTRVGMSKETTKYSHFGYMDDREDLGKDWYEGLPKFEDLLYVPTYDEVKEAFVGEVTTTEEPDEEPSLGLDDAHPETEQLREQGRKAFGGEEEAPRRKHKVVKEEGEDKAEEEVETAEAKTEIPRRRRRG